MDNEQVATGVQDQGTPIDNSVLETSSDNAVPVESQTKTQTEKMFTQSQLQAIAAKEARKAEERTETRLRAEYESKYAHNNQTAQPQASQIGGIPQMSQTDIQHLIRQEAFNMSREHQVMQIEDDWMKSMDAEKISDPEFAELYEAIGIEQQPGVILAMVGMENKAQVVKDLAKNPSKYANILTLANGGSPKLAQMELKKLSASIKANQEAKQKPKVDAPLSQIRTSNMGGDDGNMSVSDYQQQPWLRG